MIKKLKNIIKALIDDTPAKGEKFIILEPGDLRPDETQNGTDVPEEENTLVGLFCDVIDEKVAEVVHALLTLNELNRAAPEDQRKPIDFYISTYGGNADDMFALYDVMREVRRETEIHTVGAGKVMSAGVLLLAAGTTGKRRIGKNCRVMIHSVVGGSHGSFYNLLNEIEAVEQLQKMYINCLVKETKMTKKQLKNMLERKVNVYLSAEEAVELGIADIIV